MSIQVVLFDLGGVVCHFRPERRLAALASASGLPEGEVYARLWESGFDQRCDRGEFSAEELHRAASERLGLPLDFDAFSATWTLGFEPDPDVLTLVDAVRREVPTGLLTNNGPVLLQAMPRLLPEVVRRFDWLLFSCELKALKPTAELFGRVSTRLGCRAEEVLLIDDSTANVEGARACGLRACHYTGIGTLKSDFRGHGLSLSPVSHSQSG